MFYIKNLCKLRCFFSFNSFFYLSLLPSLSLTYQIGSLQRITLPSARLVQSIDVVEVAIGGIETTSLAKAASVAVAKVRGNS